MLSYFIQLEFLSVITLLMFIMKNKKCTYFGRDRESQCVKKTLISLGLIPILGWLSLMIIGSYVFAKMLFMFLDKIVELVERRF